MRNLEKNNKLYCCIWDIKDLDNNRVVIDLEISDNDTIIDNYIIELDLNKMGLEQDDEFGDELCYDIQKFINDYYVDYKNIPTIEQIKDKMESVNWLETKLWLERGF